MNNINENKFYKALEEIFVGAEVDGDGGFINLLDIKSKYYQNILVQFKNNVQKNNLIKEGFKEEFFNILFTFFNKYFSESGSVYFLKTSNWQNVYEKVYSDNKDVVLFWKTHMLYYVKSDHLFKDINIKIEDDNNQIYAFNFTVKETLSNNEKRGIVFNLTRNGSDKKPYCFDVEFSRRGSKTKIDDISKKTGLNELFLKKAFKIFKKQTEVDFFINKNAKFFLNEQLDMFLHQLLLEDKNSFNEDRLNQIKTIKKFAKDIIKFISQFENELVKIWEKPKFVTSSEYVITLDRFFKNNENSFDFSNKKGISLLEKIIKNKGFKNQQDEWKILASHKRKIGKKQDEETVDRFKEFEIAENIKKDIFIEKKGSKKFNSKYSFLPIDTKFFNNMKIEILSFFNDLEEITDGVAIKSDNWQALNTIMPLYNNSVQTVYIDPPFNVGDSSADYAYKVNYKDSTWITFLENRLKLLKKLLKNTGNIFVNCDDNGNMYVRMLMDSVFGKENFKNEICWVYEKPTTEKGRKKFPNNHSSIYFYSKDFNHSNYNSIFVKRKDGQSSGRYGEVTDEKLSPDWWDDIPSFATAMSDSQRRNKMIGKSFRTQQPEELYYRVFEISNFKNQKNIVLDCFGGSGVIASTAQKTRDKWICVEMGEQFEEIIIPTMKKTLAGYKFSLNKKPKFKDKIKYGGGGMFKYYTLEQYENTLDNMKYSKDDNNDIFDEKNYFEEYIFFSDTKLADVLNVKNDKIVDINFENLYPNIDLSQTLSNFLGLPIKKITSSYTIFKDGKKERKINTNFKNMNNNEKIDFIRMIKPLIWWGN